MRREYTRPSPVLQSLTAVQFTSKRKIPAPCTKNGRCSRKNGSNAVRLSTPGSASTWPKSGLTVASNLTLDATVNPDFGQVEADPGVLNLTAFEPFFREQRPFFVQGAGIFRFDVNCTAVNECNTGEGLVYSRRIGRAPQLAGDY